MSDQRKVNEMEMEKEEKNRLLNVQVNNKKIPREWVEGERVLILSHVCFFIVFMALIYNEYAKGEY